jgi:L-threonylcarbamoyladenylate synthase
MKYKHYSPNATVILCEDGLVPTPQETPGIKLINPEDGQEALEILGKAKRTRIHPVLKVGIIRTKHWERWLGWTGCSQGSTSGVRIMEAAVDEDEPSDGALEDDTKIIPSATNGTSTAGFTELKYHTANLTNHDGPDSFSIKLVDVSLGHNTQTIASGLFAALREMDKHGVDVIFVEAIKNDDSIAAAIMNRLKKAASQRWKPTEDGGVTKQFYGSG